MMDQKPNVQQVVPFLNVRDMPAALRFYVDGLGFEMTQRWEVDGRIRWCWLQLEGAALMLQEYTSTRIPPGKLGEGVTCCYICADALAIYHAVKARGVAAGRPFVGNGMWVTNLEDPDGYQLLFESLTDVPEETVYDG